MKGDVASLQDIAQCHSVEMGMLLSDIFLPTHIHSVLYLCHAELLNLFKSSALETIQANVF